MFYTRDSLNAVAEERGKYDRSPDNEQARADQRDDVLGDAVLSRGHLDVYLESGYDSVASCHGIDDILHIHHHRYHEVVHGCQRVRSPRVVHAAAFGENGTG